MNVLIRYIQVLAAHPRCLLLLALLAAPAFLHPEAQPGTQQIAPLGAPIAPLAGPWLFHLGDNPQWAATTLPPSANETPWELQSATQPWGVQRHPSYTGYAWYRLQLSLQADPEATPQTTTPIALLVPQMEDVYEIFWNGRSIARSGHFPPYPIWYRTTSAPSVYLLPREPRPTTGTLAIRVWKAPLLSEDSGRSGGFAGVPVLGSPAALIAYRTTLDYAWLRAHQFLFAESLLYALAGLLSLIAWLRDRRQWPLFWMTGFTLAPLIRLVLYGLRLHWPVAFTNALGPPVSSLRDISLWFLLLWLLHLEDLPKLAAFTRRLALLSLALSLADGALSLLDASVPWFWIVQIADALLTTGYYVTAAMPLVLVAFAAARPRRQTRARWLFALAAFLSGMIQVVQGMATQGSRFTHWTLSETIGASLLTFNGNVLSLPTLAGLLLLLASVYALYKSSAENRRRQTVLQQEMRSARELQRVLIPETFPDVPGFRLTSAYRPAQEVGGDFFQIIPLPAGRTLVLLGDVSGKGIKAAMAVSLILGLVRVLVETTQQPAPLLEALNRRLHGRLQGGFATCLTLTLDPDGHCRLASAGHLAPYLNHQELDVPGSIPLGILEDLSYDEQTFSLALDDHLALYTDGLLEARNSTGELFGFDRLRTLFAARPDAPTALEAAVRFGQDDDITVVTLTRTQTPAVSPATHPSTLTQAARQAL